MDGESGIRGASGGSLASFALVKDFWRSLMDLENVDSGISAAMEAAFGAGCVGVEMVEVGYPWCRFQ